MEQARETTDVTAITTHLANGLIMVFGDNADVLITKDVAWVLNESDKKNVYPSIFVTFGFSNKLKRENYPLWEEGGAAPQVVFHVCPPEQSLISTFRQFDFYRRQSVEEFYVYTPHQSDFVIWYGSQSLTPVPRIDGWESPRLGIQFNDDGAGKLHLCHAAGGPSRVSLDYIPEAENYFGELGIDPDKI